MVNATHGEAMYHPNTQKGGVQQRRTQGTQFAQVNSSLHHLPYIVVDGHSSCDRYQMTTRLTYRMRSPSYQAKSVDP
jgi:hypothetical protein